MWDLMLTGSYNACQVLEIANNQWGLNTRRGHKLCKGNIYRLFTNSFYYGTFEWPRTSDNWYKGAHEPMITVEEYDRVQMLLGRKGRPRPKRYEFAFTGLMKCKECGAAITAENKNKVQKNGNTHHYIYYHCTKRMNYNCTQKTIEENKLCDQVMEKLDTLKIPDGFHQWALKWLEKDTEKGSRGPPSTLEDASNANEEKPASWPALRSAPVTYRRAEKFFRLYLKVAASPPYEPTRTSCKYPRSSL
jgi:hypothetical protein